MSNKKLPIITFKIYFNWLRINFCFGNIKVFLLPILKVFIFILFYLFIYLFIYLFLHVNKLFDLFCFVFFTKSFSLKVFVNKTTKKNTFMLILFFSCNYQTNSILRHKKCVYFCFVFYWSLFILFSIRANNKERHNLKQIYFRLKLTFINKIKNYNTYVEEIRKKLNKKDRIVFWMMIVNFFVNKHKPMQKMCHDCFNVTWTFFRRK